MPWISHHKHKIEEKSTKSFRSSSKVVGLGLADLWEFPTLVHTTAYVCRGLCVSLIAFDSELDMNAPLTSSAQEHDTQVPNVDWSIVNWCIVEGVPLSPQRIWPAPRRHFCKWVWAPMSLGKKSDNYIICCHKIFGAILISLKVSSFMYQ